MHRKSFYSRPHRRRGTTVVEMAFVAPLFFLLVFALVELGRAVMLKQALTDAARAGCRRAVLASTVLPADAEAVVRDHLQAAMPNANDDDVCRVTISPANFSGMGSGTEITTTVEVNLSDVTWIVPRFTGGTVLRGESTMKRE